MRTRKYYWTVVILAVLFVFVIAMDVAGFIGLFTGGGEDAPVSADVIVAEDDNVPADAADTEDANAADDAEDADENDAGAPADMPPEEPEVPGEPEEPEATGDAA